MDLHALSKLSLLGEDGWAEILDLRPDPLRRLAPLVIALSMLPPVMLYVAGLRTPEMFPPAFGTHRWSEVAVAFFAAEIATFAAMGWLFKQVAEANALALDYRDAYLLAAIAPLPMWLSSLGLMTADLFASVVIATAGLGLACAVVYYGILALSRTREGVLAARVVHTVIGAGLAAWAFLLLVALA